MQLVREIGRLGDEYVLELPPELEALANDIHDNAIVFDLHLHGVVLPNDPADYAEWLDAHRFQLGYEGLEHAGLNAFVEGFASMAHGWGLENTIKEIGLRWADMAHRPDKVIRATRAEDALRAKAQGKFAVFMGIESGEQIGANLDNIDILYGLGVRSMGLTYNKRNLICDGRMERTDAGLSDFGISVIERMNDLGMIVDAAHSGVKATIEAAAFSTSPIVVSHTGARGVYDSPRLATDEELVAVANTGGLIGIHTGVNVLSDSDRQTLDTVIDHLDYCVNLIGEDHVAIGSDTYFGDANALHLHTIKTHAGDGLGKYLNFNAPVMEGLDGPSEWRNVTRALVKRGHERSSIEKFIGGNTLRVIQEVAG